VQIVIDTNIGVSGLLWRGMPWNLLRLAETGEVELCVAPAMLVELADPSLRCRKEILS
jgi:predicted nucleic acid-binding protein